jgi:AcrR family transcriptional regulator
VPRPRFVNAEPALKDALLASARKEFRAKGYEAASLNRILEDAGLSKGAFYYYFDDKADLAGTLLEEISRAAIAELRRFELPTRADDFWPRMRAHQRIALEQLKQDPGQMELLTRLGRAYLDNPDVAARLTPLVMEARTLIHAMWSRGQELGVVRKDLPIDVLLVAIQGLKEGLARMFFPADRPIAPDAVDRMAELQWDFFTRLLAPAADAASKETP